MKPFFHCEWVDTKRKKQGIYIGAFQRVDVDSRSIESWFELVPNVQKVNSLLKAKQEPKLVLVSSEPIEVQYHKEERSL